MLEQFMLIGVIILVGFFASILFERTGISDVLILMFIGIVIGPGLNLVDLALFSSAVPFVGTIALIILLFDGGINLNFFRVLNELSDATLFTFIAFIFTIFTVGIAMTVAFGWPFSYGLLFGAVIGGTSSSIVLTVISRVKTSESVKTLLTLESALTDALCIVVSVTLVGLIVNSAVNLSSAGNALLGAFSIAAMVGLIVGMIWVGILRNFYQKPYGYLLSLAIVFLLYSLVEAVQASGAIAVLVFGLVIGNAQAVAKRMQMDANFHIDKTFREFQLEITFFVRTFFFVYLGTLFNLFSLDTAVILIAVVSLVGIIVARYIGVEIISRMNPQLQDHKVLLTTMMPRGLAAAVLASYPLTFGLDIQHFAQSALLIILITNVIATAGIFAARSNEAEDSHAAPKNGGSKAKPRIVKQN
ncbi:cation:proton antiporter [Candidatus Micrarchaeota archaeon]|nr:cation:proton antiporter [Candidatus Micrarchaeota archaeon]